MTTQSLPLRGKKNENDPGQLPASEAARLLAAVSDFAPHFTARSAEIEAGRRIPGDIVDQLRQVGLFRALVPRSHGGLELSIPELVPVIEALAIADSSVGWVSMIGSVSQLFCTRVPRETYDRVYANGANTVVFGVGTPAGRAEIIPGGYRISGRWPFASGCQNAHWISGHCIVTRDGELVMSDHGPMTRFVILPAECWRIDETWYASGLAGSGSHHVMLDNMEVPDALVFDALNGPSSVRGPLAGIGTPFIPTLHCAVAVGIAAGAIADLADLAKSGRRQLFAGTDLKDSAVFQHEFGRLHAGLRAARALLQVQAAEQWNRAVEGTLDGKADFACSLQGSGWIHATCSDIVSGCYTLGGSSVVLNSSPLQRRLRDIHAARQHVFGQERFYASAAKQMLGFPPIDPITGH